MFLYCFLYIYYNGCILWTCRGRSVLEFPLREDFFPDNADIDLLHLHYRDKRIFDIETGLMHVEWKDGYTSASYYIERYGFVAFAETQYKEDAQRIYKNRFNEHLAISFRSEIADQYTIGCWQYSRYMCGIIARYGLYTIFFSSYIDDYMTVTDVNNIAIYIDRMFFDYFTENSP